MTADRQTGCTCFDETTRPCPVAGHPATAMQDRAPRSRALIAAQWPVFAGQVLARLDKGAVVYGDESLDKPTAQLMAESEQEALDIDGWGFLLWHRIQVLKAKLVEIERRVEGAT